MAKKNNLEIWTEMSNNNENIRRSDTFIKADYKAPNGFITMGVEGSVVLDMAKNHLEPGPAPYTFSLIAVDTKRYLELAEQESEWDIIKAKAAKWDKLDREIFEFYREDESEGGELDDSEDEGEGNLLDIGEIAAIAFGYL